MLLTEEQIRGIVPDALSRHAKVSAAAQPGHWNFVMANGSLLDGLARADGRWLMVDAEPRTGSGMPCMEPSELPRLLEQHRGAPGGVRFAIAPSGALRLRGEAVLAEADDAAPVVAALDNLCHGLHVAADRLHGLAVPVPAQESPANAPELLPLAEEAGYAGRARGDGSVAVPLEVHQGAATAILYGGDTGCAAAVAVPAAGLGDPRCAGAASTFLLTLSRAVRLVRPVAVPGPAVSLEVTWDRLPRPDALAAGLAALAVAHRNCVHELALLGDPVVAWHYLGQRVPVRLSGMENEKTTRGGQE
jgi:hypothetical protein